MQSYIAISAEADHTMVSPTTSIAHSNNNEDRNKNQTENHYSSEINLNREEQMIGVAIVKASTENLAIREALNGNGGSTKPVSSSTQEFSQVGLKKNNNLKNNDINRNKSHRDLIHTSSIGNITTTATRTVAANKKTSTTALNETQQKKNQQRTKTNMLNQSSSESKSPKKSEQIHSEYAVKRTTLSHYIREATNLSQLLFDSLDQVSLAQEILSTNWISSLQILTIAPPSLMLSRPSVATSPLSSSLSTPTALDAEPSLVLKTLRLQLTQTMSHLDKLQNRILDTRSRVLVTGDLNAGKSTFVNAMLRRQIVPEDQQPCTSLFAEVIDANLNHGVEQVHGIKDTSLYTKEDKDTFDALDIHDLRDIVEDNEQGYSLLKIYCTDNRGSSQQSLLHNGVVDISLIDSPGLNIDTMKTSALFAQHEEIDVVIFVVNAENHFTLSGKEFLSMAGKEKEYLFVVVNKFDLIKRKQRCKNEILDQIRQISPKTWLERDHLIHFVSSKQFLHESAENMTSYSEFIRLEDNLRSFILEKREKSKLTPAKSYLNNLLCDMCLVTAKLIKSGDMEIDKVSKELADTQPVLDQLNHIQDLIVKRQEGMIDHLVFDVETKTKELVGIFMKNLEFYTEELEWPGLTNMWKYGRDLRTVLFKLTLLRVKRCEEYAHHEYKKLMQRLNEDTMFMDYTFDTGRLVFDSSPDKALQVLDPSDVADFFDNSEKLSLAKEFAPGLGLAFGGLVGYKMVGSIISKLARPTLGLWQGTQTIFAAVTIAGIGALAYVFSDLKYLIQTQVLSKIHSHFKSSLFVENTLDRISRTTRKTLRQIFTEFDSNFYRKLTDAHAQSSKTLFKKEQVLRKLKRLQDVHDQCNDLKVKIDGLAIDSK